jgi:hypothetical protein
MSHVCAQHCVHTNTLFQVHAKGEAKLSHAQSSAWRAWVEFAKDCRDLKLGWEAAEEHHRRVAMVSWHRAALSWHCSNGELTSPSCCNGKLTLRGAQVATQNGLTGACMGLGKAPQCVAGCSCVCVCVRTRLCACVCVCVSHSLLY